MYNKYLTMKRSELKEAIKAEIKSVLSEAKFVKFKGDSDDMKMEVEAEREMNTPDGELKVYTVRTDDGLQSYDETQVELVGVNRYDINDPNSPLGKLSDEYESSGLKGIVDNYGLDVVLMMLSSGEYGDRLNEIAPMGPGQTTTLADFEDEEDKLVRVSQKEVRNQLNQYENGKIDGDDLANGIEQIVFGDIAPRGMMREEEKEEDDDAKDKKAYKGAAKIGKKKSARDEAIDAYNKIGGSEEVREKAKKAKKGDKEALNWLLSNQKVIKAYNDIPK